jgi:BirA family biotin operon repressor/biotin-[acetyl-CoA-carboxylase] ligase
MAVPGVEVRVVDRCASTNTVLLESNPNAGPVLLAADIQTAGRGRRGRRWLSDPAGGITFSLALRVARPARELAALSLVAGVAVARTMRALGINAALKWPNDLEAAGGKLGGILVETRGVQDGRRREGGSLAVIGIGINYRADPALAVNLRRRIACISELLSPAPQRVRVIQGCTVALLEALAAFESRGLDAVREEWLALHAHAGQRLRVRLADGRMVTGIADGLAENGGLQLRTRMGLRAVHSGRVVSARIATASRTGTA